MAELRLMDSEFEAVRDTYAEKAEAIEQDLDNYLTNVKAVVEQKSLEGRTADTLMEFAGLVDGTIRGELQDIMCRYRAATSQYAENVALQDDAEL